MHSKLNNGSENQENMRNANFYIKNICGSKNIHMFFYIFVFAVIQWK